MLHRNERHPSLYQQERKNLFLLAHNFTKNQSSKKKTVLELMWFCNQSNFFFFFCNNLENCTGFETFPNVKKLALLKEKTMLPIFHPLLSESPWKEQYEKSKNQCMHGRGCKHGSSCRGTRGGGLGQVAHDTGCVIVVALLRHQLLTSVFCQN